MVLAAFSPRTHEGAHRPVAGNAPSRAGSSWIRWLFMGGIALSLAVGVSALAAAYFADTAPRLPASLTTLETLGPAIGTWRPMIAAETPVAAPIVATVPTTPETLALLPRAPGSAEAPPIDVSDLPPPEHSPR
jgi:hypothetical protein